MTADAGENLLDVLREHGIFMEAPCNGRGICGKCRVQVIQGKVPVAEEEQHLLTDREISEGIRLACRVRIMEDLTIRIQSGPVEMQTLGLKKEPQETANSGPGSIHGISMDGKSPNGISAGGIFEKQQSESEKTEYQIAVDLGSTTLAAVLTDGSGTVLAQASAVNSQRYYGADVISRMQASNEGKRKQLQECICRDLENLFRMLIQKHGGDVHISRIAIAANTTMLHLLRGYSCENLGKAPFLPVNLELECLNYEELFADFAGCRGSRVYLLPGMSAFIGADITAGLYSSGFWQMSGHRNAFFIDLGTNGELAFGGRDGFVTASAAAGPAFEGGRLSCGVPGIPGAVSNVSYLYHRIRIQTIGQKKPCGICGSGALEAAAALLKEGLMDTEGLLAPELFETGMVFARREDGSAICLTQADIREIQMAKAAIRAGIEILLKKYQEVFGKPGQAERIYLAGGFGYYLSVQTAVAIGLFPAEWKERVVLCGNTSLKGAAAFLSDASCAGELEQIRAGNRSVRLESDPDFQDIYMQHMNFPVS